MSIGTLIYDFFMAALGIATGIYLLLYYKGKIGLSEERNRIRELRIEKHGSIIRFCLIVIFLVDLCLLIMFFADLVQFLNR